ncbi:hypothetical protein CP8484711_1608B, partial [Chlamydia psittaci 84-8471/1]
VFTNS